jgi:hypothetical protein
VGGGSIGFFFFFFFLNFNYGQFCDIAKSSDDPQEDLATFGPGTRNI